MDASEVKRIVEEYEMKFREKLEISHWNVRYEYEMCSDERWRGKKSTKKSKK